ncbi:hypothetical protein [Moritella viscosa]|uniref:hypothetical protein n=1 Tax=Moritella viscosa TaxID=80854 RepID=UPI00094D2F77|nr:hypothetical protein [Moritella viscosa]
MTIIITVVSGVFVFVLGQFFLKLVLEPLVSFKESLGLLSAYCLKNRASITNANASLDEQDELRKIISTILAKKEATPFYSQIAWLLRLPDEENLLKACQKLNLIAYEMCRDTAKHKTGTAGCSEIIFNLHDTSSLLGLRLDYQV